MQATFAVREALAGSGTAKTQYVPADEARVVGEIDMRFDVCTRAVEQYRLLRQPFQTRFRCGRDYDTLLGPRACGAIPLSRGRRGEQHVSGYAGMRIDVELVAARDAARRVD